MTANSQAVEALAGVLDAAQPGIVQHFFHSRLRRTLGDARAGAANREWIAKMVRTDAVLSRLLKLDALPRSRAPEPVAVGNDPAALDALERATGLDFIDALAPAEAACRDAGDAASAGLVGTLLDAERAALPAGDEAGPAGAGTAPEPALPDSVEAMNRVLPAITAAVTQYYFHSRMLETWDDGAAGEAELQAALEKMYRAESLVERLHMLGGRATTEGHGGYAIGTDRASLRANDRATQAAIPPLAAAARDTVDPSDDAFTWSLLDGIWRAERDHDTAIAGLD